MKSKEQNYKTLKQKLISIIPTVQEAVKQSDGNNVLIGTVQITFEEAKVMLAEFRKVAEATENMEFDKNVIPMKLLATDYFFREIQDSFNRID